MADRLPRVRVAAIQAAPVFLEREATVAKACRLIQEAGRAGAHIIAFPEGFVPGHPLWYHFHPATGGRSREYAARLFQNAVTVPGPAVEALAEAAKLVGAWVVVGVCEKEVQTTGTLYNSLVFISPRGRVEHVHRKLTPTVGERMVHAPGYPVGLKVLDTECGRLSGLICGENSNPLAVFVLLSAHTMVHVAAWPNFPGQGMLPRAERALLAGRAFAFTAKAFVINACGTVDDRMREMLAYTEEDREFLARPELPGGSSVVGPSGEIVAGPLGPEEGILYAELDLDQCVYERTVHDFAGHYNRPDVFQLWVRSRPPSMVWWVEEERAEVQEGAVPHREDSRGTLGGME
ncbi:MAG: aliphatic nitrilase [candidate division GAL15 bacterium]